MLCIRCHSWLYKSESELTQLLNIMWRNASAFTYGVELIIFSHTYLGKYYANKWKALKIILMVICAMQLSFTPAILFEAYIIYYFSVIIWAIPIKFATRESLRDLELGPAFRFEDTGEIFTPICVTKLILEYKNSVVWYRIFCRAIAFRLGYFLKSWYMVSMGCENSYGIYSFMHSQ